jgi:hypothetical protein
MAINPANITTIRVDQLANAGLTLDSLFPHTVGTELTSSTIESLVTLVASAIGSTDAVGFLPISVTDGQQLPDVPTNPGFFLCGAGTYLNINGFADLICTEALNAIMSVDDHWEIAVQIPVTPLSGTVQTVTGSAVDNTDPLNPVVNLGGSSTTPTLQEVEFVGGRGVKRYSTDDNYYFIEEDKAEIVVADIFQAYIVSGGVFNVGDKLIIFNNQATSIEITPDYPAIFIGVSSALLAENNLATLTYLYEEAGVEYWSYEVSQPTVSSGGVSDGDKGDITVSGSGTVWTIDNGLNATKIADGSVSNTEFQRLDGVTGNIQTQIDAKADKSTSAYSIKANNTASTANETEFTFIQSGLSSYSGTITWTGTTAPSGTESHSFNWQQIGNMVQLNLNLHYATAGNGLTAVVMTLPSGLPNPVRPTGFTGASERLYIGSGRLSTTDTGNLSNAGECFLRTNAGDSGFEILISQASGNYKNVQLTIEYFTS